MTNNTNEEVVAFGTRQSLIGILSLPQQIDSKLPAIVLVNAGSLHRVGPCRISVLLARTLTEKGYAVLRFDFSGIGDSKFDTATDNSEDSSAHEIHIAMDYLESRLPVNTFIVHGLCSGAIDAFNAALTDSRIVGLSQIDPYSYRTSRYYANKIAEKLLDPPSWYNFFKIRICNCYKKRQENPGDEDMTLQVWPEYPPRSVVEKNYQKLVNRDTKFLIVYTGSWNDTYNYKNQFYDLYSKVDFGDRVSLQYMHDSDHTMNNPKHQKEFFECFFQFIASL